MTKLRAFLGFWAIFGVFGQKKINLISIIGGGGGGAGHFPSLLKLIFLINLISIIGGGGGGVRAKEDGRFQSFLI